MNPLRLFSSLFLSAALALLFTLAARAEESQSTIAFSQPGQPGTVKIHMSRGTLVIRGTDAPDVAVKSELPPTTKAPRKDGLRVLTASSSFSLTEKDNVVTLDAQSDGPSNPSAKFELAVPRQASVVVQNSWGGDITCSGLNGNVEISGMNGSLRLEDLAGGIVASTMNGQIKASIRELREGKPLSFQSMNGEIILRLPNDTKANVRIRTQNGSVLTDFDETALVTKTENAGGSTGSRHAITVGGKNIITPEARDAIREAARVGAEAVREAAEVIREAAEVAREGAEASRRAAGQALQPPVPPPTAPRAPRPPKAMTIPTLTGGKLVTGTLNGGGPEISIATMNGDVTLRRLDKK